MENNTTIVVKQIPADISNIRHFLDYEKVQITCKDEYDTAGIYFLQIKKHLKLAEEERVKITGPLNTSLRNTNDLFKRISDPLKKIQTIIESKMRTWTDSERKRLEAEQKAKLEAEKKAFAEQAKAAKKEAIELGSEVAFEAATTLQKRADSIDTENVQVKQTLRLGQEGTVAERRVWKFKVVDETLIPREFLTIDEKKVNGLKTQYGESGKTIPGIEFYQETSFSALK